MTVLIKQKDSLEQSIKELEKIAKLPNLPRHTLDRVQVELRTLKAGMQGEKDAAYFIDFDYAPSKNHAVIHDLRLEHQGRVAQIDHLLISRFLKFYVLESKNFTSGLKITKRGEFLAKYNDSYIAIESPIEQNRRHAELLEKLLRDTNVLPTRLGITIRPVILSYVLVSPKSIVQRPAKRNFNTDMVIKADELTRTLENQITKEDALTTVGYIARVVSAETLGQIARTLVTFHKPTTTNYYERFGIDLDKLAQSSTQNSMPSRRIERQEQTSGYFCFKCKKSISQKVAEFCFDDKKRFGGRAYCFNCQKSF